MERAAENTDHPSRLLPMHRGGTCRSPGEDRKEIPASHQVTCGSNRARPRLPFGIPASHREAMLASLYGLPCRVPLPVVRHTTIPNCLDLRHSKDCWMAPWLAVVPLAIREGPQWAP